jgi:hypothetical protein
MATQSHLHTCQDLAPSSFRIRACRLLADSRSTCSGRGYWNLHPGHEPDSQHQANFHALFHTSYVKRSLSVEFSTQLQAAQLEMQPRGWVAQPYLIHYSCPIRKTTSWYICSVTNNGMWIHHASVRELFLLFFSFHVPFRLRINFCTMNPFRQSRKAPLMGGGSANRKASTYTGQHKEKCGHVSMPQAGVEPTIPVFERPKTNAP